MWRRISYVLCAVLLVLILVLGILCLTPWGVRLALKGGQYYLQRTDQLALTWQGVSGNMMAPHIQHLQLTWPGGERRLTIRDIALKWHPWALWHQQLVIQRIQVSHIQWQEARHTLPFGHIEVEHVHLTTQHWQIGQLRWHGKLVHAQGKIDIDTRSQQPISGSLHWSTALPAALPTEGTLTLSGQWDQYHLALNTTVYHHHTTLLKLQAALVGSPDQLTLTQWQTDFPLWPHARSQAELALNWQTPHPTWCLHFLAQNWMLKDVTPWLGHTVSFSFNSEKTLSQWVNQFLFKEKHIQLAIASVGHREHQTWLNAITQFSLHTPWGNWRTHEHGSWVYHQGKWSWSNVCLQHQDARMCSQGFWQSKGWQIAVHSNAIPMGELFQPIAGATLTGTVSANLDYHRDQGQPLLGTMHVLGKNIALRSTGLPPFEMRHFTLVGQAKTTQWQLRSDIQLLHPNDQVHFQAQTQLNPKTFVPTTTKGLLMIHIHHLQLLNVFVPELYQLTGQLDGHIHFFGAAQSPQYEGKLTLDHAATFWPELGLSLKDIRTRITTHTPHTFHVVGSLKSGKGTLQWQGHINTKQLISDIQLHIQGKQVLFMNTPALEMVASPDLTFRQNKQGRQITGAVRIGSGLINASQMHSEAKNNADVVLVNEQGEPIHPSASLPLSGHITLQLGKDILFNGFGISTQVKGQLNVAANARSSTLANGTLYLFNGHYSAYGKTFALHHGQLIFTQSPLNNPALDVTAEYQFAPLSNIAGLTTITAGVHVTGTLAHPKLTLYSRPPMSQENILSYIVLGQPIDAVSGSGNSALSQAAALYALRGGNQNVLGRVQDALGLDNISVGNISSDPSHPVFNNPNSNYVTDGSTRNSSAVFIGKSLTNRLYISYGVGVQNNQQEVRARYRLSRYFSILTDHSTGYSGADLVFTIDY